MREWFSTLLFSLAWDPPIISFGIN
jgi:hypothetical protein